VSTPSRPKHVFVINDTPAILDLFRDLLEEAGYRVTLDTFSLRLEEEVAQIKAATPDVVVLDFVVGGERTGWQLLQLLKMDRETRDIPVLICTAAVRQVEELQPHLDEMGVAVVLKPFDIDQVLAEIERAWRRRETRAPEPPPEADETGRRERPKQDRRST
jgi:DNA-binding response OmpR family regulator